MKYKLWWVALVVLAGVCAADVVCFAFMGFPLFYEPLAGMRMMLGGCSGAIAVLVTLEGCHLSDRSK